MNFRTAFELGQKGSNKGLPMGEGLKTISQAINGIQGGRVYAVAASPKGGKSTFVDVGFCIEPAFYVLNRNASIQNLIDMTLDKLNETLDPQIRQTLNEEYESLSKQLIDLDIIYNSYEINRVSKEFDFMAHFLNKDYGIYEMTLPQNKFYKGKSIITLSSAYLRGELQYDEPDPTKEREVIRVSEQLLPKIKEVYKKRIVPLFGEYTEKGEQVSKGLITFLENADNPTGIRNYLMAYAKENGEFIYKQSIKDGVTYTRCIGYNPRNPEKYVVIITDHIRKLIPERNFSLKETIDKYSQYCVELRNLCNFSFVNIVHLNRSIADVGRRQLDDDRLFPNAESIKESG